MGVAITNLLEGKTIEIESLSGKIIAIDAFNIIYQFLSVLRGPDGSPLTNSKGKITSHLKGLLSRNVQFLKDGLKPIYVFDGKPPELKSAERDRRKDIRDENQRKYEIAKERNDMENMRKYSQRLIRIDAEVIESSKKLLDLLGIPWVQAKSEGEAQAAYMAIKGDVDYVVSQDADGLLFGAPNLVRNLSITGKRKKVGTHSYEKVKPQVFSLTNTLNQLGLDKDQLIVLAMLVGTDYNIGGIKGLGPKKALNTLKLHGSDFESLFKDVGWDFDVDWKVILDFFKNPPVTDEYELEWKDIDSEELQNWLRDEYEFSEEGLKLTLKNLDKISDQQKQKGLGEFF